MPIRVMVKGQQSTTVSSFDSRKPIDEIGRQLIEEARAAVKKLEPEILPKIESATKAAVDAAARSIVETTSADETPTVVAVKATEAAIGAAVGDIAGPAAEAAVEAVLEKAGEAVIASTGSTSRKKKKK